MYRAFLAHGGWRVPRPALDKPPTIIVSDTQMTMATWLLSSDEAYQAACKEHHERVIGPVWPTAQIADVVAALDPNILVVRIDPGSPISLSIQTDELVAFRQLARAAQVEQALAEHRLSDVKRYDRFYVPYFGVLGQGHNVIALPTAHGSMVAAFTAPDHADAFLATGSDADRERVNFVAVDGAQLFGSAGPTIAQGVIVNFASERPFGFTVQGCRDVMESS